MTASSVSTGQVLALYRSLLRQSGQFQAFNYRKYAVRRVRDHFKEKKILTDQKQIKLEYKKGLESLEMLKRQTAISQMYSAPKLVVEKL